MPSTNRSRPLAVVDIDGVVADVRHRVHHLDGSPPDWFSFFEQADRDPPLPVGIDRALTLAESHEIVWLTGRPEWLRPTTSDWLAAQGLPEGTLLMRPNGDHRPARDLKSMVVRGLAQGRILDGGPREIALVLDDDASVVTRLRRDGWPVERADWVGLTSADARRLAAAQEDEGRT